MTAFLCIDDASIEFLDMKSKAKLDPPCIDNLYSHGMSIGTWIREARKAAGITQEQLGDRLGVTKGNVSSWENDRHQPSYAQIRAVSDMSGLPPPGEEKSSQPSSNVLLHPSRNGTEIPPGYVRLTMFDATPYMGGTGTPVDFPDVLKYVDIQRNHLSMELGVNPDHVCLLPVRGDSMSGTIEHGDMVFVDQTIREFDGDGVYVLVWNVGLIVKRVQGLPRGGLRLKSDNTQYDPVDLSPEDAASITICGRVVGSWKVRRI